MKNKRQKRNRMIAILTVVILSIGMTVTPLIVSAHGVNTSAWYSFSLQLDSVSNGYNTPFQYKNPPFPLFWVDYQYCSYGPNYPVNFLIVDPYGVQISNNIIINGSGMNGYTTYYASNHDGFVRVRANTGSYQAGYSISGEWAPNAFYCGD